MVLPSAVKIMTGLRTLPNLGHFSPVHGGTPLHGKVSGSVRAGGFAPLGRAGGDMTDVRNQQRLPVIGQLSPSSIHRVNEREIRRDG